MYDSKRFFVMTASFLVLACAHGKSEPEANATPPAPEQSSPVAEPVAESPSAVAAPAPVPVPVVPKKPAAPADEVWKVKNGKVGGKWPKALQIGKFKNKKLPGFTTDTCYNFGEFSVVETQSTGEMGSAEIVIRYAEEGKKNICAPEFKGRYSNLKIVEGHFAGVVGEYVLVDGDDKIEGTADFQLFTISTGKEAFRGKRNPEEDLVVSRKEGVTSVQYFAKVKVSCELAHDGEPCWKKVLAQNEIKRPTPMPDCKGAFEKAKISNFEMALVTVKAQVANVANAKMEYLGGKATCVPAPP